MLHATHHQIQGLSLFQATPELICTCSKSARALIFSSYIQRNASSWTIRRCCLMHKRLPESWWPRVLSFHCWVASNDLVVGEAVYRKAITISHVWEHRNKSRKDNPLLWLEELSIFVFKRHNRTNLGDCGFRLSSIRFLCNFSNIVPGGFFLVVRKLPYVVSLSWHGQFC